MFTAKIDAIAIVAIGVNITKKSKPFCFFLQQTQFHAHADLSITGEKLRIVFSIKETDLDNSKGYGLFRGTRNISRYTK